MANTNAELIAYLKTVDTATLANAIELLNLRPRAEGYASLDLKCLFPEFGPMCGYAVTAHAETVTLGAPKTEEAYVELFEAVEASPKPAVVVIQEIGAPLTPAKSWQAFSLVWARSAWSAIAACAT
jgi:4-hydroxy-4-methyl-2-oxoglutarate aldolase